MPLLMDELGFTDIVIDSLALTVAQDNADNSYEYKKELMNEQVISDYEVIKKAHLLNPDIFTINHLEEMQEIIKARNEKRIIELNKGIKKWNYTINMMIIVSGKV
jgi:hypothetical protein